MFLHLKLRTAITALEFISDNLLLAGSGPFLFIFDVKAYKEIFCEQIFEEAVIHGIKTETRDKNSFKVLVFGQKRISLNHLKFELTSCKLINYCSIEFDDWILDAVFGAEKPDLISLILMRNEFVCFDVKSHQITTRIQSKVKCVLYCAKITCTPEVTVFAGTGFDELIVWKPTLSKTSHNILFRLSHTGPVYFVDVLDDVVSTASADRRISLWNLKTGLLIDSLHGHLSRVWIARFISRNSLVSAGEDGALCIWNLPTLKLLHRHCASHGRSIWSVACRNESIASGCADSRIETVSSIEFTPVLKKILSNFDTPKCVAYLGANILITLTYAGGLFLNSEEVLHSISLTSSSVLLRCPSFPAFALSSLDGNLYIGDLSTGALRFVIFDTSARIQRICWCSMHSGPKNQCLAVTFSNHSVRLYSYENLTLHEMFSLEVPKAKSREVCAALSFENHTVLGCRDGSMFVYKHLRLIQKFFKLHGPLGIASVHMHDSKVYCASHDGIYSIFSFPDFALIRTIRVGYWIDSLFFSRKFGPLAFCFHGNNLVVFHLEMNCVLLSFACGGAHRSWDYCFSSEEINFIFVRNRNIQKASCSDNVLRRIQQVQKPLHGRIIRHTTVFNINGKFACFTASDDNLVKLFILENYSSFEKEEILGEHVSAVCMVRPFQLNPRNCILVSCGARLQVKVWHFNDEYDTEYKMTFAFRPISKHSWKHIDVEAPPDAKLTSVCITKRYDNDMVKLFFTGSDGILRSLLYDPVQCVVTSPAEEFKKPSCLMCSEIITLDNISYLLAGVSNGSLAIFNIIEKPDMITEVIDMNLHDSAITSLHAVVSNDMIHIASGTDSGRFHIMLMNRAFHVICQISEAYAHLSSLTGIKFLTPEYVISTSTDQRVKLWHICDGKAFLTETVVSSVRDVCGVSVSTFRGNAVVVTYGEGLQLFKLCV